LKLFGQRPDDACRRGKGVAERYASAFEVHPLAGYRSERRGTAELLAAVIGGLPMP
jgi:hypothetical protein